jgi:multicomponent Na+:H+ antiporter subunit C
MDVAWTLLISKVNYFAYVLLMCVGLYAMLVKKNLMKKIIGLNILQTAVILFYISIGAKKNATIPILLNGHDGHSLSVAAADYINPLPHVLMLTAIVVAVATLGVVLALAVKIYQRYGTLEEGKITAIIKASEKGS